MADDLVALFLRGAEIFGRGDEAAALDLVDEQIELIALRSATEGPFRGHDGIRAFFADNRESFARFEPRYDDVRDLGDGRVIGLGHIRIRGRESGVETDVPSAVIAQFREGRMTYLRDYGNREKALEAAGADLEASTPGHPRRRPRR